MSSRKKPFYNVDPTGQPVCQYNGAVKESYTILLAQRLPLQATNYPRASRQRQRPK